MHFFKQNGAGLLLCLAIALPCWYLGTLFPVIGGPVFAILAGMVLTLLLRDKSRFAAGIAFTSKKILQYAVVLLGFGLNLSEIAKVGALAQAYAEFSKEVQADGEKQRAKLQSALSR